MLDLILIQPQIQKALDLFATCAEWDKRAAMKADIVGLQGEKRRLRYLYRKADNICTFLQHSARTLFKVELYPSVGAMDFSKMISVEAVMDEMIEKLWKAYEGFHTIANDMVQVKLKPFSDLLYDYASCIFSILFDLERARIEYSKAGYEYHHVSRYQVGYYNVHDEYEDEEEKQGYIDKLYKGK